MDKKESLETTGLWVEMGKNGKGELGRVVQICVCRLT